ncbi:MAG: hypothetical protein MUO85_01000, partial [candidate division Zixibacteria bacterium]|nr:hypothetical protein [candidate division Zixibacteria bacterium]
RVDLPPFEKEYLFFFFFVLEVSLPFLFTLWQVFYLKSPTKILHYQAQCQLQITSALLKNSKKM